MNELIQVREREGRQAISARELYEFLGFDVSNWSKWYQKNIVDNPFAVQGEDWEPLVVATNYEDKAVTGQWTNPRPSKDFLISLDFAKRLAMMARTPKGEEARRYFIECEQRYRQIASAPPVMPTITPGASLEMLRQQCLALAQYADVMVEHERLIAAQGAEIHEIKLDVANIRHGLAPKAEFFDEVIDADGLFGLAATAQMLGTGQKRLIEALRDEKVLCQKPPVRPYQQWLDAGYFEVKLQHVEQLNRSVEVTFVTTRGVDWLRRKLASVLPAKPSTKAPSRQAAQDSLFANF